MSFFILNLLGTQTQKQLSSSYIIPNDPKHRLKMNDQQN